MGGKKATTTSKVTIPPEVLARYNAVNKQAVAAAATPYQAFGKTAADYVAQMNAQQGAGIADINATAGSYQPYMTQATSATQAGMGPAYEGIENYMSPYIKNVADTTGALMRQQQEQAQSGALGTAAMSGAFGGDRAGIAAANLQQQNQLGYGKTMADIMNQGYTQALGASQADLARQLQGGAQMAGLGAQSQQLGLQGAQAKIAAGTMQQQTEQAGKDAMINQFMQEKGYPFQVAQFLANIAMGTGAASGSTTTTQTPRNWLGFASGGAVEGYASGGVAGPRTYTQQGVGGEGYVPAGDLPVGQLMIADPPDQSQGKGTEEIIKLITKAMGAARGGAIDQRHGYALDGRIIGLPFSTPVTDELRERLRLRPKAEGYDPSFDYRKQQANIDASMAQDRANPSNMGLAGHMYPKALMPGNDIPPLTPRTTPLPVGPEEQWDIPVRSGMKEPGIPFRSGMREPEIAFRGGMLEPEMPFRSGMEKPEIPFRSGLVPFESSPAVGGPGTFAAGAMPSQLASMRPQRRPEGLGYQPTMPEGGPATMAAGMMPEGLAPTTSPFPPARPAGLAGADVADAAMTALGQPVSADLGSPTQTSSLIDQTAPTLEPNPSNWNMADTGLAPTGGYKPIIPLKTQLQFVTSELQQPEYSSYLKNTYATPAQAAIAFEQVYERANGAGNDVAAANATDIYNAAQNGKLDQMPPNVVEAYNHFVQNGMDPVQAAGAAGRLMVESYSHLDPNARNTLGGGYGTYGIAQWRGDRIENLANFAGVPVDAIANAPVSTPEGRYYTHGANFTGGAGGGLGGADMSQQRDGLFNNNKPYADRNMIGKFFHDPTTGKLNPNAVMALLSGIGNAAQAQTISPLGGILAGIGAGSDTYKNLLKQQADIGLTQAQAYRENVGADVGRFFTWGNIPMVSLGNGKAVKISEYLASPEAYSTGNPQQDAAILRQAQTRASTEEAAPTNTRWTNASNDAIAAAKQYAASDAGAINFVGNNEAVQNLTLQANEAMNSAVAAKPNVNELAYTVGSSIADGTMGSAQGRSAVLQNVLAPLNSILRSAGINMDNLDDTQTQAQLLDKISTLNADSLTPEQQRSKAVFQQFANVSPNLEMTPDAAAAITSSLMLSNQYDIDTANYYNRFQQEAGMGFAPQQMSSGYTNEYGQLHQIEKNNLTNLFTAAEDKTVLGNSGMTRGQYVKNFLDKANSGGLTQDQAQAILNYILGPENTSQALARYFIKGM